MKINLKIFCTCSIFAIIAGTGISNAAVTARQTPANTAAANRAQNRAPSTTIRMPTTVTETATTITAEPEPVDTTPVAEPDPILEPVIIVDNKTSIFSDVLSEIGASATDSSNSALAETIRRQRALLDAKSNTDATTTGGSGITTANACDAALRKCMTEKCGNDFTKCASDSTTAWGNKMDSCRRNTKCTGHEYSLLAPEILADRNAATELSYYNSVVNCGNRYNDCMFNICGKSLEKCLSKSAGDGAVAKCKSIADECREQDSGLAARIMDVMADNRKIAAADAQKDEKRLYELRDLMRTQCTRFGAMFDERTLDCVYTVNFFAGEDHTLMASKKLYSGDTFQCTPDWFGVDITTYIENAQRLTRSQTSASAAAMGAGVGTAAGLVSSGAIGRAIDTQNAEKQAKEACINDGGEWVSAGFNKGNKCDMTNAKENCPKMNGKWDGEKCIKETTSGANGEQNGNPQQTQTGQQDETPIADRIEQTRYCMKYNNKPKECNDDPKCQYNGDLCERKEGTPTETSSTGGGRNPANPNIDCDKACDNALRELKDDILRIKDAKLYNFTASVAFSNPQCAKDCVTKADTVCKTLVDDTKYTTSEDFKNSVDDFKYHQITNAHAERDGNNLIECKYESKITGQVYPTPKGNSGTTSGSGSSHSNNYSERTVYMYDKKGNDYGQSEDFEYNEEDGAYSSGHRMSMKPNDTQQSGGSGTKTCQQVCADIKKTFSVDLFHKKLPISNPSCENTCDPDLKDFCKSFATKKEIIQFGNSKHRILWASSSWRDGMYGCQWSGETVAQNQSQSVQCDTYLTSGTWQPKCTTTTQRI